MSAGNDPGRRARRVLLPAVVAVAGLLLLAGCSGNTPVYVLLQNSIKNSIDAEYDHLPVASVACDPQLEDVSYGAGFAHLVCVVRFEDGRSYSTPATIEAVIGANGEAQTVTATTTGLLDVGTPTSFSGTLSGIAISQLEPAVPERLARLIATRGGVPTSRLRSFDLIFLNGGLAGWNIATATKGTRFQAHLVGDSLEEISPHGTRSLD